MVDGLISEEKPASRYKSYGKKFLYIFKNGHIINVYKKVDVRIKIVISLQK